MPLLLDDEEFEEAELDDEELFELADELDEDDEFEEDELEELWSSLIHRKN